MVRPSIATCALNIIAILAPFLASGKSAQGQSVQAQSQDRPDSATLQGSVRDSTGRPVAAATVYLQGGTQTLTARTDSDGAYRFSTLREGTYTLRAELSGYHDVIFGPCVLGQNESKRIDLTLGSQKPSGQQGAPSGTPEFFDEPEFTVAGVTEATNPGGHGSDTILRTTETLAKETASLVPSSSQPASSRAAVEDPLRRVADHEPGNFDANHRIGMLLLEDGKSREALRYLERASQLQPGNYENCYQLALAYSAVGQYEHARTHARNLLTVEEKAGTRQEEADLHHLLGEVEEKLGNPLEAVREYQHAAELNPSEANVFDWGAELLTHRAFEPAVEVFTKGNRLFPRSVRMLAGLGVAWYARGSYDQAAQCLCQASDLNPGDPNPYLFLGKMQSVENIQSQCLVERLERFARLQPENAMANYYYALGLWKWRGGAEGGGNAGQVESLLEKTVKLDPKLGAAYLQLGILYSERGDSSKALFAYQKAADASPHLEEAHFRLAQAYNRAGEKLKAQAELQLYDQLSKMSAQQVEHERREIQQFVFTLRDPALRPQ
jgi:tetratricopeptide (TPR) repeat protein